MVYFPGRRKTNCPSNTWQVQRISLNLIGGIHFIIQVVNDEMTEDFKHAMIDSIVISAEDKYGHHLNKEYDWMDDYMV